MSNFLIKLFIHNNENILNIKTRNKYCYLSSFVGVFFNLILFIIKLFIGILLNSITIISDAFENLTDLFEYKELTKKSKTSQKDVDDLVKTFKKGRWERTKQQLD